MGKLKISLIIVTLLVIAGGVFWYQSRNPQGTPLSGAPMVSDKEAQVVEGGNAVNVENQPGGETVAVDLVVLEEPGFVAIHKATKDDKPGEIVGHSDLLEKGQSKDVVVEVDPMAVKGDVYFAMLHADTDGDEDFGSTEDDQPLKDDSGNIVMMKFTITSEATPIQEE